MVFRLSKYRLSADNLIVLADGVDFKGVQRAWMAGSGAYAYRWLFTVGGKTRQSPWQYASAQEAAMAASELPDYQEAVASLKRRQEQAVPKTSFLREMTQGIATGRPSLSGTRGVSRRADTGTWRARCHRCVDASLGSFGTS